MNLRILVYVLATLAVAIAAGASYYTGSWMPLIMATPIALIAVVNMPRKKASR